MSNIYPNFFYLNPTLIKFFVSNFFVFWVLSWPIDCSNILVPPTLRAQKFCQKVQLYKSCTISTTFIIFKITRIFAQNFGINEFDVLRSLDYLSMFFVHFAPSLPNAHFRNKSQQKTFFKNFLWRKYVTNIRKFFFTYFKNDIQSDYENEWRFIPII